MENVNFWINIVISILTGLSVCIPLVIKLVTVIKESVKAKNWTPLMQLVIRLIEQAEDNFETGAEKKEWVIDSIKAMEGTLNYDIDEETVGKMIDSIIEVTKRVNVNK